MTDSMRFGPRASASTSCASTSSAPRSVTTSNLGAVTSMCWWTSDRCRPSGSPAYFGLLDELRAILGSDVDLVMVGALKNRYIREDVNRTKRVLYAA